MPAASELVARPLVLGLILHDQRRLREREQGGERNEGEGLELDPHVGRLRAPDDLVEDGKGQEEERPAPGELAPPLVGDMQSAVEQDFQERLLEPEADEQSRAKQDVKRGRLDLDQRLVMKDEGKRTKHEHDHRDNQRHDRKAPEHRIGDSERDQDARHQDAGRGENAEPAVGDEEQRQRPKLERELEHRIERFARRRRDGFARRGSTRWRGHAASLSIPAIASAKSRAVKGSRSSTPSPTPMKWTGNANLSAIATRMPPRAVPSSLVITRPVTPATRPKISTWLSAFCPTVASSTSSTAWGASASTFRITRRIFSSSFMSSVRFCKRPAVSMSTTSMFSSRAFVSASKASPAASAPWSRSTMAEKVRLAQMRNCSIAAARNVSPAASSTALPSALNLAASLPMVVVLPEPLTPTTRITNGRLFGSITSWRATGASDPSISAARIRLTSSGLIPRS